MVSRISASEEGLKIINLARERKGWAKAEETWFQSALTSKSTLKRFWLKKRIDQEVFVAICEQVGVKDWQAIVAQPPPTAPMPPNPRAYKTDTWVGRSTIIDELLPKLQDKTRLVWITGISGIGKTTLGECLASRAWESNPTFRWDHLEVSEGQGADFTTIAADLLAKLGDRELDPQERNDPKRLTDRLVRKLQSSCYWVQLDSLERLLNPEQGTEFADDHWVIFLRRCLTERDFGSRLVLTAQALPSVLVEWADRYPNVWTAETLAGLSANETQNEHLEFFGKHGVAVDEANQAILSKLGQVYEGHTLVLQVMSGEIQADFAGDAGRYWVVNQQEFEQVARSLDAKRLDETEYNDELDRRVRDRVKKSLQQLPMDAQDLLLRSSVYRRPVSKKFWLAMIDDRSSSQQKEAYRVLCDRALVEKEHANIRQHNLIRSISHSTLQQSSIVWRAAERKAANLWLVDYEAPQNASNLETLRGYLEAFEHYWNIADYQTVLPISSWLLQNKLSLQEQLYTWSYFRDAIALNHKLLIASRRLQNIKIEQQALSALGINYECIGDYENAVKYHDQHLTLAKNHSDYEGIMCVLGNLSAVFLRLGDYANAKEIAERQRDLAVTSKNSIYELQAITNIGCACLGLRKDIEAIKYLQIALNVALNNDNYKGIAIIKANLADAHQNIGEDNIANIFLQDALIVTRENGDIQGTQRILEKLGQYCLAKNDCEEGITHLQNASLIAQQIGNSTDEERIQDFLRISQKEDT
jgi:tetratricopeptide (TPR) repeat protein